MDRRNGPSRAELLQRIRAEFNEMAGMSLTGRQAFRLFDIDPELGRRLLEELVRDGFLRKLDDETYGRAYPAVPAAADSK